MRHFFLLLLLILSSCIISSSVHATGWQWDTRSYKKQKYVTLDSLKKFYRFKEMTVKNQGKRTIISLKTTNLNIVFTNGSQIMFMNNVKFNLSKPIVKSQNHFLVAQMDLIKMIDPVLRPKYIQSAGKFNTVIIDPGHGGKDPGAVNSYGTEADYNLKVAKKVEKYLKAYGYKVIMTRRDDTFISLAERVRFSNRFKNAIFISIHFNAVAGARSARGMETFTLSPEGVPTHGRKVRNSDHRKLRGNAQDSLNIALATAIHGSTLRRLNIFDRGIKRARYSVLTTNRHPSILIEGGFLTNAAEARRIHQKSYQSSMAKGIAEGVRKYRIALSNRRLHKTYR